MIFLQKQKYKYVDVWFDCEDFLCNVGLYKIWLIVVNDLVENILFIFSYLELLYIFRWLVDVGCKVRFLYILNWFFNCYKLNKWFMFWD